MAGKGQVRPLRAQGRDSLDRRSAYCRVPLYLRHHHVSEPRARSASRDPYFHRSRAFPRERRPQHALRRSGLPRERRSSSREAEARAPPSLAFSPSRDLAYVTVCCHLGPWLSNKFPVPPRALLLEARLSGRGLGSRVPVPALRCRCPRGAERG